MTHETEPEQAEATEATVVVTVVRSGGFAGLTRRWGVQAPPADAARWRTLVDDCPWHDYDDACADQRADDASRGADRFSWTLHAMLPDATLRADLTETQATGPWRALIDAVREVSGAAANASS